MHHAWLLIGTQGPIAVTLLGRKFSGFKNSSASLSLGHPHLRPLKIEKSPSPEKKSQGRIVDGNPGWEVRVAGTELCRVIMKIKHVNT